MTIKEKLSKVYQDVQSYQFQPTQHNVVLSVGILQNITEVFNDITEMEKKISELETQIQNLTSVNPEEPETPKAEN